MDALVRLRKDAADCADARAWAMSQADLLSCVDGIHEVQQVLTAALAHLVTEIGGRGIPRTHGGAAGPGAAGRRMRVSGL